jgi:hypothetical protein
MVLILLSTRPKLAKSWSQFAIPFTKIIKSLAASRPTREFCYGVFNDPYMQIRAMTALSALGKRSDELEEVLQSLISGTDTQRNIGRAILYQAVETIVVISKKQSLRGLAFNQVGRLLSLKEPNILYSALSSFARVLYSGESVVSRGSVDSMALQRYKAQIVKCLNHADPSIRRRALDVISALIDETNAETLIPEIMTYVGLADAEFRTELVAKICGAAERFAPSKIWKFETILQIIIDSGNYVSGDVIAAFCEGIAADSGLQIHAVEKLSECLVKFTDNQTVVQVAGFVLGEFAVSDESWDNLEQILVLPQTKIETKLYLITALAKMAARLGEGEAICEVLGVMTTDNNLEIQQRSGELMKLFGHRSQLLNFLAPVASGSESEDAQLAIAINSTVSAAKAQDNQTGDDLLVMMLDSKPSAKPVSQSDDLLGDILTIVPQSNVTTATAQPLQQQQQQPQQQLQQQLQQTELLRNGDFVVFGQSKRNPSDPKVVALRLLIYGISATFTDFRMEYRVTPGWEVHVQPPDGNVVSQGKCVSQVLFLANRNNAPFQLFIQAQYKYGSQPLKEQGVITVIPPPE